MTIKITLRIIMCLLVFLSHSVFATNYYIAKNGNNSNSGRSPKDAWASADKSIYGGKIKAGDTLFFIGGESYTGSLYFDMSYKTTEASRIVICSYGKKKATLNSGDSTAIFIYNNAGFTIMNLNITGSGSKMNKGCGILFHADDTSIHRNIILKNLEISGFGQYGIMINVPNTRDAIFSKVSIENVISHDNLLSGIMTTGTFLKAGHYSIEDLRIEGCETYNNFGNPEFKDNHSGNGIVCGSVRYGLIQKCISYNNGKDNGCLFGGPVGIWCWASTEFTIQFCESHHNHTGTLKDGGGFDLDGGVTNSVIQYNYSHDNDGSGFLVCQFAGAMEMKNLTVRYNISENDGRKNETAGILFWSSGTAGGIQNAYVYNNTIYMSPQKARQSSGISIDSGELSNIFFLNNIIVTTGGVPLIKANAKSLNQINFLGNCYWQGKDKFSIQWGEQTYNDYDSWQAASSQERGSGNKNTGINADPKLANAGRGVTLNNPELLSDLEGYKLSKSSPVCEKGLSLAKEMGMDGGSRDFFGNKITRTKINSMGAFEECK
jgi:hypothetical protein